MPTVTQSMEVAAAPETAWALVGNPAALGDWHPAVVTSKISDRVRRCTLVGEGSLVEPIVEHSDQDRFYVYDIGEGPFPTRKYRSRIAVEDADGGSRLVWRTDFEADDSASEPELSETFAGIYRDGLQAARDRLERAAGAS